MKTLGTKMNRMNPRRGSASILVIMLSLVLVVFGVFSMMTAHAGLAVARRHGEWNTKYHQVESETALIAAEFHQLVFDETADVTSFMADDTDVSDQAKTIMQSIESRVAEKKLPVTITKSDHSTEVEDVVFLAEISVLPPTEDRIGFYSALQYRIDLSKGDHPRVVVEKTVWKSVTEDFEYKEDIEFRDVEVEVQVE